MRKLELIEAINKRLSNPLHPKTLSVFLGRAFNQILFETFRKDFSGLDLLTKTYRNVPIEYDEEQDIYYSDLPATIVKLPIAGDGVRGVNSMKSKDLEFVPIKSGDVLIQSGLEVSSMPGNPIPYYIMDERVEYVGSSWLREMGRVKLRLVRSIDEYDMLENIYIPSGRDELLIETTVNMANGAPTEKEINDNSDKTK